MFQKRYRTVLEIGTHKGGTAAAFLKIDCDVTSLDTVKQPEIEDLEKEFPYNYRFVLVQEGQKVLFHDTADVLFIDGDHTYEGAKFDYESYQYVVNPGGIIVFHDIIPDGKNEYGCVDFWNEIKEGKVTVEKSIGSWGGLGVIFV